MPFYRTSFERVNYTVVPPAKQTSDVIFECTSGDQDEENALANAAWVAMWAQNPHWLNPSEPRDPFPSQWSSVLWNHKIEPLDEKAHQYVAWHIPSKAWFTPDGVSTTVDVDEAGRFSLSQVRDLRAQYPGERHSMVMEKHLWDIYHEDGTARTHNQPFRLRFDEYVLWGAGPRDRTHVRVSIANRRVRIKDKFELDLPFQLAPGAQEYERRRSWAWKLFDEDTWHLVDSPEEADSQARQEALKLMRGRGDHECSYWLAIKHNREVINALEP